MVKITRIVSLAAVSLAAVACGEGADGREAPALPPLALLPKLPLLKQQAATASKPPSDKRMAELSELIEAAFASGTQDRVRALAKRNLDEAEDVFWALEKALEHDEAAVRSNAAYELGRCATQAAILPLLKRLKYEQEPLVRVWVASALAGLGNHAGLQDLVAGMERNDTAQQAGGQAIGILKALGAEVGERPTYDELKERLRDLHRKWRRTGIVAAGKWPQAPDELTTARIAAHVADLEGFQLRPVDDARFVLGRAGVLPLALLREAVQASETYVRNHALEIVRDLGRVAGPLGPKILPLLADPLSQTYAAQALGSVGERQALPHLLLMLRSPQAELRATAAGALGPLGDKSAIATLQAILDDEKETMDVRVAAAFSLAIFEQEQPALDFLRARRTQGDYHRPTIEELIDRVEQYRRDR
ncbi:MAG: HEAT repeat domain-containing protein [Planctomycetota bacterium]|jgi:HEAT repeat protein